MSELCHMLHELCQYGTHLDFLSGFESVPFNGIYLLFERGENGHEYERIVRVGTHTGKDQLVPRLKQHFIKENKDRSIFRKNIGRAILKRQQDPFLEDWEIDLTTRKAKDLHGGRIDVEKQQEVEHLVTNHSQTNFSFLVFAEENKPRRLELESKIISTISWCDECRASQEWLGLHSPKKKIRESGLWLVNGLYKEPLSNLDLESLRPQLFVK